MRHLPKPRLGVLCMPSLLTQCRGQSCREGKVFVICAHDCQACVPELQQSVALMWFPGMLASAGALGPDTRLKWACWRARAIPGNGSGESTARSSERVTGFESSLVHEGVSAL